MGNKGPCLADVAFLDKLIEENLITRCRYDEIIKVLSQPQGESAPGPCSVLHVLAGLDPSRMGEIAIAISKACRTPLTPLASFSPQPEAWRLLPESFMTRRGAVAFALMDRTVLVAVLNPLDADLRHQVSGAAKRDCQFFMAMPEDYDAALNFIRVSPLNQPADAGE